MTELSLLLVPIVLSTVFVFIASSIIHMVSPWHKSDYPRVPNEDRAREVLRALAIPPGDYMIPRPSSRADLRSPEFAAKVHTGHDPDGHAKWPDADAAEHGPVAALLRRGHRVRGVHRRTGTRARCGVSRGIPFCRRYRVHRLRGRVVADVDLVPPIVDDDVEGDDRWLNLRVPHGGNDGVAVATVDTENADC
jgi:hypothetical protein